MTPEQQQLLADCYRQYNDVIKPLIAEIEARAEVLPLPLLNEIRAYNDHVARCYFPECSSGFIDEQLEKASRHILRLILDCFKALNVILYSQVEEYQHETRHIDLTVIDNGLFYPVYSRLKRDAATLVFEAKRIETISIEEALYKYQDAYNKYSELVNLIADNRENTKWAKVKAYSHKGLTFFIWLLSIVISAVASMYLSCEGFSMVRNFLFNIFD